MPSPTTTQKPNPKELPRPNQNIDASLSPADIKAIKTAFDTVLQKMPFLISLTPKERKSMFKADPDSVSFVQNTLNAAQDHPDILPATFKTGEFKNDVPPCATFCVIC